MKAMDSNGKSDPYVKLSHNEQNYKSKTQKKTLSPIWNEKFTFKELKDEENLKIEVFDHDFGSKDDFMGSYQIQISNIPLGKSVQKVMLSSSTGYLNNEFFIF